MAGACYIFGILIVYTYLQQFGDFNITLLQVDYVMAGALFLFAHSVTVAIFWLLFHLLNTLRGLQVEWRIRKQLVEFIATIGGFIACVFITDFLVTILRGVPEIYGPGNRAPAVSGLLVDTL